MCEEERETDRDSGFDYTYILGGGRYSWHDVTMLVMLEQKRPEEIARGGERIRIRVISSSGGNFEY